PDVDHRKHPTVGHGEQTRPADVPLLSDLRTECAAGVAHDADRRIRVACDDARSETQDAGQRDLILHLALEDERVARIVAHVTSYQAPDRYVRRRGGDRRRDPTLQGLRVDLRPDEIDDRGPRRRCRDPARTSLRIVDFARAGAICIQIRPYRVFRAHLDFHVRHRAAQYERGAVRRELYRDVAVNISKHAPQNRKVLHDAEDERLGRAVRVPHDHAGRADVLREDQRFPAAEKLDLEDVRLTDCNALEVLVEHEARMGPTNDLTSAVETRPARGLDIEETIRVRNARHAEQADQETRDERPYLGHSVTHSIDALTAK